MTRSLELRLPRPEPWAHLLPLQARHVLGLARLLQGEQPCHALPLGQHLCGVGWGGAHSRLRSGSGLL